MPQHTCCVVAAETSVAPTVKRALCAGFAQHCLVYRICVCRESDFHMCVLCVCTIAASASNLHNRGQSIRFANLFIEF